MNASLTTMRIGAVCTWFVMLASTAACGLVSNSGSGPEPTVQGDAATPSSMVTRVDDPWNDPFVPMGDPDGDPTDPWSDGGLDRDAESPTGDTPSDGSSGPTNVTSEPPLTEPPLPPACVGEEATAFCARHSATCGTKTGRDNCGVPRTEECGECGAGTECTASNTCKCVPKTDADICADLGVSCGSVAGSDGCGGHRAVECGGCRAPLSCGGGGQANQCGCKKRLTNAELCMHYGKTCGFVADVDPCVGGRPRVVNCGKVVYGTKRTCVLYCGPNADC